jgi:adenosylmethionine-8-amino-7-oxononanoate aminotransferase
LWPPAYCCFSIPTYNLENTLIPRKNFMAPSSISYTSEEIQHLVAWDHAHVWHPFTQMQEYPLDPPLVISHGQGVYLYDVHGKRYFDANSSLWVNIHGHARPEINQAIAAQLEKIAHSTLLGPANVPSILLAKRLADLAPAGLTKVFYSDNGSTAVEVALKMAFQYWLQTQSAPPDTLRFIKFEGAYHGDTLGSVSVGGVDLYHGKFGPLLFACHTVPYPAYSRHTASESPQAVAARSLDAIEGLMQAHPGAIPAVIIEPLVQGAGGMRTCVPGFLRDLRALCDRHGVLLILDEVFTGFGRTGALFACQHEDVVPDILALSKGLTAGYLPLAVTLTHERIYQGFLGAYAEFKTFFHGHSYTGNQVGCATALASLDLFEQDQTLQTLPPRIAHLAHRLDRLFQTHDTVMDVRQCGFIAAVELCASRAEGLEFAFTEKMGAKFCLALREKGIWIRPLGNTIVIVPPLITTEAQLDFLFDTMEETLANFPNTGALA